MAEIEVVKKYVRILFSNESKQSPINKKNIKLLERFALLVEDEMPELYHQTLNRVLEYDTLRYYEERQPVAVAIALINDKIDEFIYSEQDNKMQVIVQTLGLIAADRYQNPEVLEHVVRLYFADFMNKVRSKIKTKGTAKTKKVEKLEREKRERKGSRLHKITSMLDKIRLFKDQISKGDISIDLNAFWAEVEDYLKKAIEDYEKMKDRIRQYNKAKAYDNSAGHVQ